MAARRRHLIVVFALALLSAVSCSGARSADEGSAADDDLPTTTAATSTSPSTARATPPDDAAPGDARHDADRSPDPEELAPGFELVEWSGEGPVINNGGRDSDGGGDSDQLALELFIGRPGGMDRLDLGGGEWSFLDAPGHPALVSGETLVVEETFLASFQAVSLVTGESERAWPQGTGEIVPGQGHLASPGHVWILGFEGEARSWKLIDITTGDVVRTVAADRAANWAGNPVVSGANTGGVFRLGPDGYRQISDDRLLAAGEHHALVRSCPTPRSCVTGWIDATTGETIDRPFPPDLEAGHYHLSTNGRLVLGVGGGLEPESGRQYHWLHDTEHQRTILLPADDFHFFGRVPVSLSPDGRVVAVGGDRYVDLYLMDDDRIVRVPATETHEPTVLLSPPPEQRQIEAPALADVAGPSIPGLASYPDPADEPEIEPSEAQAPQLGRDRWLGCETGLSLVIGDRNNLQVVDLDRGSVTDHEGLGFAVGGAAGHVIIDRGELAIVPVDEPDQEIDWIPGPVYTVYGALNKVVPAAVNGQVWLRVASRSGGRDEEWVLFDLTTLAEIEAQPWRWWHHHQPVTGFDDPIQTSDAGGVLTWDGDRYVEVFDGGLKAVGGDFALVESCRAPGVCRTFWLDTRTWSEVDRNLPATVLDGRTELSRDGRLLSYTSAVRRWWTIYDVEVGLVVRRLDYFVEQPESISPDGRYVTLTFRGHVPNLAVYDVETGAVYVLPVEIRAGESMPVFVDSP